MLELCDAKLQVVPLVTGDEAELAQSGMERHARALSDTNRVAAPPCARLVDPRTHFFFAHPPSLGQRLGQLVCALGRQGDRADERE